MSWFTEFARSLTFLRRSFFFLFFLFLSDDFLENSSDLCDFDIFAVPTSLVSSDFQSTDRARIIREILGAFSIVPDRIIRKIRTHTVLQLSLPVVRYPNENAFNVFDYLSFKRLTRVAAFVGLG